METRYPFMSFFISFWCFSMKNFAWVIGLLFGSAGANTYLKPRQVALPPSLVRFFVCTKLNFVWIKENKPTRGREFLTILV